jgi:hypothetical protein
MLKNRATYFDNSGHMRLLASNPGGLLSLNFFFSSPFQGLGHHGSGPGLPDHQILCFGRTLHAADTFLSKELGSDPMSGSGLFLTDIGNIKEE